MVLKMHVSVTSKVLKTSVTLGDFHWQVSNRVLTAPRQSINTASMFDM